MRKSLKVCLYLVVILITPFALQGTTVTDLFEENTRHTGKGDFVEDAVFFSINQEVLKELYKANLPHIDITIPFENGKELTLNLDRTTIVAKDFKAIVQKGNTETVLPYTLGHFYKGAIAGVKDAFVAITLQEDEVTGVLTVNNHNYNIGRYEKEGGNSFVLYREDQLNFRNPFTCSSEEPEFLVSELPQSSSRSNKTKVVQVYVECDYDLFTNLGRKEAKVLDFATGLFNIVTTLYAQESITLEISEIKVWSTPDPYVKTSGKKARNDFADKLNGDFNGDIAHLLSNYLKDGNPPNGGSGFLNALCDKSRAVSYTNITTSYSSFPTFSWSAYAVTHEIGHNLGSPHTHSCSWPTGPLDNCWCPEGGCSTGPEPTSSGTIMSYCHLDTKWANCSLSSSNPGINFAAGFGKQPGDLIRSNIAQANCLKEITTASVPALSASIEVQHESCVGTQDGEASAEVQGGQAPYRYRWSNSTTREKINNLRPASYTVTVTDRNGKTATASATIQAGKAMEVHAGLDKTLSCGTQEIQLDASASTSGSQYRGLWTKEGGSIEASIADRSKPILSVAEPGTYIYTLTHTVSGCTSSDQVVVSRSTDEPSLEVANMVIEEEHCGNRDGSIRIEMKNTGTYTVQWNTGDTGLHLPDVSAGQYTATISNEEGCSTTINATVKAADEIKLLTLDVQEISCYDANDGSISVEISGGVAPYQLLWSSGIEGELNSQLGAGTHSLEVEDANGCVRTFHFSLENPAPLAVTTVIEGDEVAFDVVGGSSEYEYYWSNGWTGSTEMGLENGDYQVTIMDSHGCSVVDSFTIVAVHTPTEQIVEEANTEEETEPLLSPNPADTYVRIYQEYEVYDVVQITIFNANGHNLYTKRTRTNTVDQNVNTSDWKNGTYYVKLSTKTEVITEELKVVHN